MIYFIEIHNVFCLISVLLRLMRLVLCSDIWSIWTIFLMYLKIICILLLFYISILCEVFMHIFNSKQFIVVAEIFCFFIDFLFIVLSIIEIEMLNFPTINVELLVLILILSVLCVCVCVLMYHLFFSIYFY